MNVRFAARDPGGANVLAAFLDRTAGSAQDFVPDVWSLPKAGEVFERAGVRRRVFAPDVAGHVLAAAWAASPADALITGTSHYAGFESLLWAIARRHGCRSLALLDQWCNLAVRFAEGRPDCVGAIDAPQRDALIAQGFAPGDVLVAGHPWLADLMANRGTQAAAPRTPAEGDAICVLFVSENIAADVASGRNAPYGFDEIDAFDVVFRAACGAAAGGTRVSLRVKLHPYEDPVRFEAHLKSLVPCPAVAVSIVPRGEAPRAWVLWADLVVGISSMLLFEALVLDRPVVSVQPGLARENTFMAGVQGYAQTLTDPDEGAAALTDLLRDPACRARTLARHRAFTATLARDPVAPVLDWIHAVASRTTAR